MYKEYRDISLNGAISQLYMEMSSRHRARHDTIHILRATTVEKAENIKRTASLVYRDSKIKFPILKTFNRAPSKRFRTTFKAARPSTYR